MKKVLVHEYRLQGGLHEFIPNFLGMSTDNIYSLLGRALPMCKIKQGVIMCTICYPETSDKEVTEILNKLKIKYKL